MSGERTNGRNVSVRLMTVQDIDAVVEIERESFTLPWSAEAFRNELRYNQFAHYLVLEVDKRPAGYGGMWVIIDEAHVTNIAVKPGYRKQGYGERILRELINTAVYLGAKKMTLEVRVSNWPARHLYEKLGFRATGVRKGYYSDNQEDALIMWADLPDDDCRKEEMS